MLKKLLNFVILLQVLALIAVGAIIYYLYKVRVVENVITTDVRKDITDETISKIKAESLTLDSLIQKKENPNFAESYFITSTSEVDNKSVNIQPVYKLNQDSIEVTDQLILGAIPQFNMDNSVEILDDNKITDLIINTIKQNSFKEIDIDVSVTNKVSNIETVVRDIITGLNPSDIKINLGLPLKWSDHFDYIYMEPVSKFYKSNASISILNNLCNKFRINAYGYTTINSSNAGPITKTELAQDSIKYYIYKGLNSNKIDLVINNTGYLWANRNYTDNYLYNYVVSTQQVVILNNSELNNYLSKDNFRIINNFDNGENLGVIENNGNINYLVYPRLTQLSALVDIAKSYGLSGFIYKNF